MTRSSLMIGLSWIVGGAAMIYFAKQGQGVGIFVALPVICTSWLRELRGALIAGLCSLPFTMSCLTIGGVDAIAALKADPFIAIGHGVAFATGLLFGYSSALRHRLERETVRRVESERAAVQAEMEAQLLRADRLATVGTLAAGVAHEVNNPLTFMLGNLELARDSIAAFDDAPPSADAWRRLRAELVESLADAHEGGERIAKIVGELKLFVRERSIDEFGEVALGEVLQTSMKLCRHELGSGTVFAPSIASVPAIRGDAGKLAQVFVNLLVNASHAIPSARGHGRIGIELAHEGEQVVVTVSDDGEGMTDEVMRKAFEPFFTTKPVGVGTGLGLAVCASIIREHGGSIELHSERGHGTRFRLSFPALVRELA